jgi:hypothetical protein
MQVTYSTTATPTNNLWQLLQDYCETNEPTFVGDIPKFIQTAEARIYNAVNLPVLRNNVTGALTVGNKYLMCPTGWLSTYSIAVVVSGVYSYLLNKDVNFIREAFPDPTALGQPTHYAQFDDDTLILGPTPDIAYPTEMHYKAYPQSITVASSGQTWLGDNFGDVLLYGSLREAYVFQKGEADMIQAYNGLYEESLSYLKLVGDGEDRRDAYRSGQVRVATQ